MKKFLFLSMFCFHAVAQISISQLPLKSASTTQSNDSFPFVSSVANVTNRLTIYDIVNIPTLVSTYAPLASPAFTGTVTMANPLGIGQGGTGVASVTTVPAVSSFSGWDASKNLSANSFLSGYTTTATAAGTTTLTVASSAQQYFTGSTTQTVVMPVTGTLALGQKFNIVNNSSGAVTVQSSGTNSIQVMAAGTKLELTVVSTSLTTAAAWNSSYSFGVGGSVTSVALSVPSVLSISGSPVTTSGTLAVGYSGTALPIANGGTAVTSATISPTASSFSAWDANKNLSANNLIEGYATTATASGTTALLVSSTRQQYFTGTLTQTVTMPVVSGLVVGQQWTIVNMSSGAVTVQSSGANTIQAMASGSVLVLTCISTSGTGTASWNWSYGSTQAGLPLSNPMSTAADMIIGGASGTPTRLANGTSGQVLMSAGGTSAETWQTVPGNTTILKAPTFQSFLATNYQTFTVSSANATVGATYTNNGQTFTVVYTIASGLTLVCSGTGAPAASGTLTKSGGTGDATITFSAKAANGTYFPTNSNVLWIRVRIVGGGGGGSGSGLDSGAGGAGGTGGNSSFGTSLITANGGPGGAFETTPSAGGSASLGSGPVGIAVTGGSGSAGSRATVNSELLAGGSGASTPFGGAGGGGVNSAGVAAATNTGAGGGGASGVITASAEGAGSGGSAGGFVDAMISSPSASYIFVIGAGGTAGSAGTSGNAGGAGGSAGLWLEEHYQ